MKSSTLNILVFTILLILAGNANSIADVKLFDLDSEFEIDLTEPLQQLTEIDTIEAVTSLDVTNISGDDWLVVQGDGEYVFLETTSFSQLFRVSETDLRAIFQLSPGTGYCTSYHTATQGNDYLLYHDVQFGDWYYLNLTSGHAGLYTDLSLTEPFYCGFSYTSHSDIGLLVHNSQQFWWYESLPGRETIDLDLTSLFGANPTSLTEFELYSNGTISQFLMAVVPNGSPGTPTATPTSGPGTPTATPTTGTTEYQIVMINGYESEDIWRVNAADYSVEESIAPTGASPNQIIEHQGELFVVNSLSHSITVYDPHSLHMKRELSTGIGKNPMSIAFVDNEHFYVTQFNANSVTRVNAFTGQDMGDIEMPTDLPTDSGGATSARPSSIVVVDNTAYVACSNLNDNYVAGGPGVIVKINTETNEISGWTESGGRNCIGVHHDPRHPDWIWTTNAGDYTPGTGFDRNGTVAILSIGNGSVTDIIPVNTAPFETVIGANRAYFSSASDGQVGRLDLSTLSLLSPVSLPTAGKGLNYVSGLKVGPDQRLWVLEFNHDKLYTLNTLDNDVIIQETAVGNGPDDMIIVE